MSPSRVGRRGRRDVISVAAATLLAAGLAVTPASPAAAEIIQCAATVDVFVWDGGGGDRDWANAHNWDTECTPGLRFQTSGDPYDDVVTIPAGANVLLADGSAHIASLYNFGAMTVAYDGKLITLAESASNSLTLNGTLGGTGRFVVTKVLKWVATAPNRAASQTTRECGFDPQLCVNPVPPGAEGTTVIAPGAKMNISGHGVNLDDQRVIENHGTVTLSGNGYVAADDGTWFRNFTTAGDPIPQFVLQNDGGYYQGNLNALGLSRFTNSGKVVKSGGTGLSLINAAFSPTDPGSTVTGSVEVRSGTLSILGQLNQARKAKVQQGRTFGNGGCDAATLLGCQELHPTSDDDQLTTVELTQAGTTLATVTIEELQTAPVAGQRGVPVQIDTPNALSQPSAPLRFRMLLDASLLNPGETPEQVARFVPVYRQATAPGPYTQLPNCGPSGNPTMAQPTCVARALSVAETTALGNGDVVLVISSLQNSRYRIGG